MGTGTQRDFLFLHDGNAVTDPRAGRIPAAIQLRLVRDSSLAAHCTCLYTTLDLLLDCLSDQGGVSTRKLAGVVPTCSVAGSLTVRTAAYPFIQTATLLVPGRSPALVLICWCDGARLVIARRRLGLLHTGSTDPSTAGSRCRRCHQLSTLRLTSDRMAQFVSRTPHWLDCLRAIKPGQD